MVRSITPVAKPGNHRSALESLKRNDREISCEREEVRASRALLVGEYPGTGP